MEIWFYTGSAQKYKPKLKYIVEMFFSIYGLKFSYLDSMEKNIDAIVSRDDLLIVYDKIDRLPYFRGLAINRFDLFFMSDLFSEVYEHQTPPVFKRLRRKDSEERVPLPFNLPVEGEDELYSIEDKKKRYAGITWKEKGNTETVFYADLFASSFYFVSLQEEIQSGKRDKHNRFRAEYSFREKEGLIDYPLVNRYFKILFDLIQKRFLNRDLPLIRKSFWPGSAPLAVVLTHDVDIIEKWVGYAFFRGFQLLSKMRVGSFFILIKKIIGCILKGKNPALSFDSIIEKERESGFSSTFFFLCGKPSLKSLLELDITYDLTRPKNGEILKKIISENREVGLHGSYHSFSDLNRMGKEKNILKDVSGRNVTGIRQHYLRFNFPQTLYLQESLNFSYDCSLGYPDASGFRSGLGFPFYLYDDSTEKVIKVLELNTTIMDQTYVKYKKHDLSQMKKEIIEILTKVEECGGMVNLLWHTNTVDEFAFFGFMNLYDEILKYLKQRKALVSSAEKIARYWQKRERLVQINSLKLEDKNYLWEFEPEDTLEKATLEIDIPRAGSYKIRAENVQSTIEISEDRVLIGLSGLKPGQKFKIYLQRK
ncbi:MAG: polysaccharide deacetylase family protein [candidate division Zixibacteria bacterium]|nr:polysaccharide deacetylase family protein [candidate division Zixibacteria bacterium]